MKEYIIFLDESGDHNLVKYDIQYPIFTLVGCIFEKVYYEEQVIAKVNKLKINHFNNKNTILHSYEIRKAKNDFKSLLNPLKRKVFIEDMNILMQDLNYTIISSCIRKDKLTSIYNDPSDPYELSFSFIIERFIKFLQEHNGTGIISIEARDNKSNNDLINVYNAFRSGRKRYVSQDDFEKHIQKIEFIGKTKNINGHQIADLVAYPISRFCLDKDQYKNKPPFSILKSKFRRKGNRVKGYGYKEFP